MTPVCVWEREERWFDLLRSFNVQGHDGIYIRINICTPWQLMQKTKDRCCILYRGMFCLETTISRVLAVVDRSWLPLRGQRLYYAPLERHLMLAELYLALNPNFNHNPHQNRIWPTPWNEIRERERERESEYLTLNAVEVVVVIVPLSIMFIVLRKGREGFGLQLQLQRIFYSVILVWTFTKLERRSFWISAHALFRCLWQIYHE